MNTSVTKNSTDDINSSTDAGTTATNYRGNDFFNNNNTFNDLEDDNNSSYFTFFGLEAGTCSNILKGLIVFSALTVLVNCMVLIASKFTTGGKSSTLVFIRSLCLADVLVGNFGIFKCILLQNLDSRLINCFLPESIFASASTTICFTLFWLNVDSYLRLTKPLLYRMDKHNVIIAMLVLWNSAFIIGFLPQMGWSNDKYVCKLFEYYDFAYVNFLTFLWLACIVGCWVMQAILFRTRKKIEDNGHFISPQSLEFKKYMQLIFTIQNDIIVLTICYVPLIIYVYFYSANDRHKHADGANINIIFFLPLFLLRSFFGAFIHSYRTIRIQRVMKEVSKSMNMAVFQRIFNETSSDGTQSGQESRQGSRLNSIVMAEPKETCKLQAQKGLEKASNVKPSPNAARRHRQLCAAASVITTVTEDEELSDEDDLTKL